LKEEYLIVLLVGIILPILFTPILIDAVEVNEETLGVVVEFVYPKNLSNEKSDIQDQLNELFASDKPTVTDSALIAKSVILTDELLITDSAQIELFATDAPSISDSVSSEVFNSEQIIFNDLLKDDVVQNEPI